MDWLLNTTDFVTRDNCGAWSDSLILVYQMANLLIALSYFSIPFTLYGFFVRIRKKFHVSWVVLLFVIFIAACGLTHLCDVLAFSWAPYRLFTLIDSITALASVPTAFLLPLVVDHAFPEVRVESEQDRPQT